MLTITASKLHKLLSALLPTVAPRAGAEHLRCIALGVAQSGALLGMSTDQFRVTLLAVREAVSGADVGLWLEIDSSILKEALAWLRLLKDREVELTAQDGGGALLSGPTGTYEIPARGLDQPFPWSRMQRLIEGSFPMQSGTFAPAVNKDFIKGAADSAKALGADLMFYGQPDKPTKPCWISFGHPEKGGDLGIFGGVLVMPINPKVTGGIGELPETYDPSVLFD